MVVENIVLGLQLWCTCLGGPGLLQLGHMIVMLVDRCCEGQFGSSWQLLGCPSGCLHASLIPGNCHSCLHATCMHAKHTFLTSIVWYCSHFLYGICMWLICVVARRCECASCTGMFLYFSVFRILCLLNGHAS